MTVSSYHVVQSEHEAKKSFDLIPFDVVGHPMADIPLPGHSFKSIGDAVKAARKVWPNAAWTNVEED